MAMWRDPLDELIADLERAVPLPRRPDLTCRRRWKTTASSGRVSSARDPAKRLRLAEDPRVKRVWEYYQRLPRSLIATELDRVEPPASGGRLEEIREPARGCVRASLRPGGGVPAVVPCATPKGWWHTWHSATAPRHWHRMASHGTGTRERLTKSEPPVAPRLRSRARA